MTPAATAAGPDTGATEDTRRQWLADRAAAARGSIADVLTARERRLADLADATEGRLDPIYEPSALDWRDIRDWNRADAADEAARRDHRRRELEAASRSLDAIGSTFLDATRARIAAERALRDVGAPGPWRRPPVDDARTASLDTGQHLDISDAPRGKRRARNRAADASKVALADALRAASLAAVGDPSTWAADDASRAAAADGYRDGAELARDSGAAILLDDMAGRLGDCRRAMAYRDACGAWWARPKSCHVRLCPDCERARSSRLVRRLEGLTAAMSAPKFWTVTIPNVPPGELGLGVDVLLDALAHLRRRAIFTGGPCKGAHRQRRAWVTSTGARMPGDEDDPAATCAHPPHRRELAAVGSCHCARCIETDTIVDGYRVSAPGCPRCHHDPVRGGVYSIEVTWNPEHRAWHPHAHMLLDGPYIPYAELRDAWRAVTCDATRRAAARGNVSTRARGRRVAAGPAGRIAKCEHRADGQGRPTDGCRGASIVWVEAVKGEPGSPERRGAIREALKYVTKGVTNPDGSIGRGLTPADIAELILTIRSRRLVAGWGSFRNVRDDDEDDDGPELVDGLPRFCPACGALAAWSAGIDVPRVDLEPAEGGIWLWKPPPIGPPATV